jgi:hypothetical protein
MLIRDTRLPRPAVGLRKANFRKSTLLAIVLMASAILVACGGSSSSSSGGPASQIAATGGSGQSTSIGTPFAAPFAATVEDSKNNVVGGATVTFTAPSSGPSGTFANGQTTETDTTDSKTGVATSSTFTANTTLGGPYSITAAVSGVSTTVSYTLFNTAAGVATASSGFGQGTLINTQFSPLTVTVTLQGTAQSGVVVTFTAPTSGASGTFAGGSNVGTATTDSTGLAKAPAFTANGTTGVYQVIAQAADAPTPATFDLVNVSNTSSPFAAGNYVYSLSGTDANASFYNVGGVFTVDANGLITGGYQSFADFTYVTPYEPITGGGALVQTSDGNVRIVLNTGNQNIGIGLSGEEMFDAAVISGSKAFLSEFDTWATASGELDLQTLPSGSDCPNAACNYAFLVSGKSPGASPGSFSLGGILDVSGPGTISGGIFDASDNNNNSGTSLYPGLSISSQSSFSTKNAGLGVLQFTLDLSGLASDVVFDGYIVDANHIRLVETGGALGYVSSGIALVQTGASLGTVCTSGLGYVIGMKGGDEHGVLQIAGLFTMPSTANANMGGFINYNDPKSSATQAPLAITAGTCTPDTTYLGRVSLNGVTLQDSAVKPNLQFYVTGDSDGDVLALSLDSTDTTAGHGYQQTGTFATGSFSGTYAIDATGANNPNSAVTTADEFDAVGAVTANGNGAISGSGSVDLNWIFNSGPTAGLSVSSGSYAVGSEGVFTGSLTGLDVVSSGTSDAFTYYLVDNAGTSGSSSRVIAIETDTNQLSLDFLEQQ